MGDELRQTVNPGGVAGEPCFRLQSKMQGEGHRRKHALPLAITYKRRQRPLGSRIYLSTSLKSSLGLLYSFPKVEDTLVMRVLPPYKKASNEVLLWVMDIYSSLDIEDSCDTRHITTRTISEGTYPSAFLLMAKHIASHSIAPPEDWYRTVKEVIALRTTEWHRHTDKPCEHASGSFSHCESCARSNKSHRFMIDILKNVFDMLGGPEWESSKRSNQQRDHVADVSPPETDPLHCENRYSMLDHDSSDRTSESEQSQSGHESDSEQIPLGAVEELTEPHPSSPRPLSSPRKAKKKSPKKKKHGKKIKSSIPRGPPSYDYTALCNSQSSKDTPVRVPQQFYMATARPENSQPQQEPSPPPSPRYTFFEGEEEWPCPGHCDCGNRLDYDDPERQAAYLRWEQARWEHLHCEHSHHEYWHGEHFHDEHSQFSRAGAVQNMPNRSERRRLERERRKGPGRVRRR